MAALGGWAFLKNERGAPVLDAGFRVFRGCRVGGCAGFRIFRVLEFEGANLTTPECWKGWPVLRPPVWAVSTFENKCLARKIDVWQPLPRFWRATGVPHS